MKGLDVSNHQGEIAAEWWQRRRAEGYRFLIAGTHSPAITRNQVFHASQAGLKTECYVYVYPGDVQPWLERAVAGTAGLPVSRCWLDYEDENLPYGDELVALILQQAAVARYMGFEQVGLYFRREWYERHIAQADDSKLARFPLWTAHYDRQPLLTPRYWRTNGYGPWWKPSTKQYEGTTDIDGIGVDLNWRIT